jgi:hypothetical protein
MDRITVLKAMEALQKDLAHNPDYMDLSGYASELKWLIIEVDRLKVAHVAEINKYHEEVQAHLKTKASYVQTAGKLKRFKKRMSQIREIAESENPSIKDIRYLANGYEMRDEK